VNLFVGVVIDEFSRLKQDLDGSAFMTLEQRQWYVVASSLYVCVV
jgi:hypothetical protein